MLDSQVDFTDIFSRSDLFDGLGKESLGDIFNLGCHSVYEPGAAIFWEGDPTVSAYLLLKGRVKLSKLHPDGKEAIVRYIPPGGVMAAVSVFKKKEYPVTARAVERSEVVGWTRETMLAIMTAYPQTAINLLGTVVERLDEIQTRYLELQTERVGQRLARALLRIMKHSGCKTDQGIVIDFRLSRQDLADYIGTTLYTVSRTLSHWEKKGWVRSGRERIVVTDPHALVSFAETG